MFPDFVSISAFKDAICQSLKDYNKQIDQLKTDMEDATRIADAMRQACELGACLMFGLQRQIPGQTHSCAFKSAIIFPSKPLGCLVFSFGQSPFSPELMPC